MTVNDEMVPQGTHPVTALMINRPILVILPLFCSLVVGMILKVGQLFTAAFLYLGVWCVFRYKWCGTPQCGVTGPLFLLIALFSLLLWVPPFADLPSSWSSWDHLIVVAWLGATAAFTAQWLITRKRRDLIWTAGLFPKSLLDYVSPNEFECVSEF